MKVAPPRPEIPGIELALTPWPWQPMERQALSLREFEREPEIWLKHRDELNAYAQWAETHYLLPGHVRKVTRDFGRDYDSSTKRWGNNGLFSERYHSNYHGMMQAFEQDFLGLEPDNSRGGLRWWASAAGGSSGNFPTETIAATVGMESGDFLRYIRDNRHPVGMVAIRADAWVIPVDANQFTDGLVIVDDVQELSPLGMSVFEGILKAYAQGIEYAHNAEVVSPPIE